MKNMLKNKHAQLLGRLAGKKKTKEEMKEMAKKRWDGISDEDREKYRQQSSERMKKYWIGWREAKEKKEQEIKNSVKKAFKFNKK